MHPEIQDKLFEEIDALESIDHETIQDMAYLEAAIHENLRLYPSLIGQERICKKDVEVKGIKFKKGMAVKIPIYSAHHNPDFFPEPEVFKPERFLKENKDEIIPYTYIAFSGGPRICLGQRFAMVEMKIGISKILKKFRIEKCPETKLEFLKGDMFLLNYHDVLLKLVPRD